MDTLNRKSKTEKSLIAGLKIGNLIKGYTYTPKEENMQTKLNNGEIRYISRLLWNAGYCVPLDERDIQKFVNAWKTDREQEVLG